MLKCTDKVFKKIFYKGIYWVYLLTISNVGTDLYPHYQPILNTESSQVPGVCTMSTCTSIT